jgi:hypothetical protein
MSEAQRSEQGIIAELIFGLCEAVQQPEEIDVAKYNVVLVDNNIKYFDYYQMVT